MNIPYIKNQDFENMENNLKIIYNNTNKVCHAILWFETTRERAFY